MVITCQNCGARFQIRDELVADGPKRTKCKKCGEILVIKPPGGTAVTGAATPASPGPAKETVKAASGSADLKSRETVAAAPKAAAPEKVQAEAAPAPPETAGGGPKPPAVQAEAGAKTETPGGEGAQKVGAGEGAAPNAADTEDIQAKLEKRRLQMEDEISGRLNKAALETLDFEVLGDLAKKIKSIEENTEFQPEAHTQLFACISCLAIYSLFTEDPRQCANCAGDLALVRGDDILKQFGMFNR